MTRLHAGPFAAAAAALTAAPAHAAGHFDSNDQLLNATWQSSVATADAMVSAPVDLDARGCPIPAGVSSVILDGVVRDRCPYIGDEAVSGIALALSQNSPASMQAWRNMLLMFAGMQHADGAIPASPFQGGWLVLNDYCAYFVETARDYLLWTGDTDTARPLFAATRRVLNGWYPTTTGADGLMVNRLGPYDYAYLHRNGSVVAYFNALEVRALRSGAQLADWLGQPDGAAWRQRADRLMATIDRTFYDERVGAYSDTTADRDTHPQDANAILALEHAPHARQALAYLDAHMRRGYGNTMVDTQNWDGSVWGWQASERVYPFIGFFEVMARFEYGLDSSAQDLLRREWGYMVKFGPADRMTWETIGPFGGPPTDKTPSWASGWSAGAAPAQTMYVLGVQPTSPGFATVTIAPHIGDVGSASGTVPTPHGDLAVSWKRVKPGLAVTVKAPAGVLVTVGHVRLRGARTVVLRQHLPGAG